MARPKTKTELLNAAETQYERLNRLIDNMGSDKQHETFDPSLTRMSKEAHWTRDKNLRDILAHLYEWQQMLLSFVDNNSQGHAQPFLPATHTWRTTPALNQQIWAKYQNISLEDIRKDLAASHCAVVDLINSFTDEELFTKMYFPWTGTTSLGSYCVSSTSSHYEWAIKKLRVYNVPTTLDNPQNR
ncbi:ClbS/DfsB family four-helix bundle protein [Arcanobacterium buesumense]|uniref:ClbS/DfsB family four-helix bundle protein n=1 Tax=Arcanobacterium buesumense TaxID=2722751 RepID=A0A6H2ELH3_9ACTO|nr:ClbS/DfsB family four-helix bundle protein [Arcanobacterium buesumense]QJC21930.1 ClbS/DfsB family four-helix bundle protein [Arcanobacterium buesumense]